MSSDHQPVPCHDEDIAVVAEDTAVGIRHTPEQYPDPPLFIKEGNKLRPSPKNDETPAEWCARLYAYFGSKDVYMIDSVITDIDRNVDCVTYVNEFVSTLPDIKPRDSVELRLAVQMFLTHYKAMRLLRRSEDTILFDTKNDCDRHALQFLRLYTQQLAALKKYRGESGQRINVNQIVADKAVFAGQIGDTGNV